MPRPPPPFPGKHKYFLEPLLRISCTYEVFKYTCTCACYFEMEHAKPKRSLCLNYENCPKFHQIFPLCLNQECIRDKIL